MGNRNSEPYEIDAYYVTKTEKAICITDDLDAGAEIWLPIYDRDGNEQVTFVIKGNKVRLEAPQYLLEDKGLV